MTNSLPTPQSPHDAEARVGLDWKPTWGEIVFVAVSSVVLFVMAYGVAPTDRAAVASVGLFLNGAVFSYWAHFGPEAKRARIFETWTVVGAVWLWIVPWFLQVSDGGLFRMVFIPVMALAFETPSMTARRSELWRFIALGYAMSYATFFIWRGEEWLALVVLAAGFAALSGMGIVGGLIQKLTTQRDANHALAHTDVLTGLGNRRGWGTSLDQLEAATHPSQQIFTCFVFDIDHFKRANERFGHLFGDSQLRQVADVARETLSDGWTVARVGGDEFAAIAPGDHRFAFGEFRRRAAIGTSSGGASADALALTAGVAVEPSAHQAWVMALGALRTAKRTKRGTTLFAGSDLDQQLLVQKEISSLQASEVHEVIRLVAQPIVDGDKIVAYECLARWCGSSGESVTPDIFVPIFEEAGLAHMLGNVVVEKAIDFVRTLPDDVWVSVNISPSHFQTTSFAAEIARLVAIGRVAPNRLTIEVTESQAVTDHETWLSNAARLRRLGLGVAVDDFGAGWSSLDRLIQLDLTALKIDRGIVTQLGNAKARALLAAVAAFTDAVGIRLIAEGVETKEQVDVLGKLGFRAMQGYYFRQPIDLDTARREVWDQYLPMTADSITGIEASGQSK